jgi:hypothetical protein
MHEAIQSLKRRVEALEKASAPEPRVAPVAAWTAKSAPPRYDEVYAPACVALAALGGAAIGILILWVLARAPRGNGRNNE